MLPIEDLEDHLLLSVLKKLGNVPLCRIRKTCKFLDLFAEEHREKLSARAIKGVDLIVSPLRKNEIDEYSYADLAITANNQSTPIPIEQFDFETQLSGISIHRLKMEHLCESQTDVERIMENLKHFPSIEHISLAFINSEVVSQILDVIQVRNTFDLRGFYKENANVVFENLNKISTREAFCVSNCRGPIEAKGLFAQVKNFAEFSVCHSMYEFDALKLLEEILATKDNFPIRKIEVVFRYTETDPASFIPNAARFTKFWIPHLSDQTKRRMTWNGLQVPVAASYTQFNNKYALVIEYKCEQLRNALTILFVEDASDFWLSIFKAVGIHPTKEKKFMQIKEKDKGRAITGLLEEQMEGRVDESASEDLSDVDDDLSDILQNHNLGSDSDDESDEE